MKINYAKAIYNDRERQAVLDVFDSGWFSGGKYTHEFEEKLAKWWGVKYALAVNSGSSANFIAIQSLGLEKNIEVITPALAFPTTVSGLIYHNLIPVYAESDDNLLIDLTSLEELVTSRTRALVFAHTLGNVVNMDKVMEFVNKHDLKLIEDCCFIGETLITTKNGKKPIKDIAVGDLVLTRDGYKKVIASEMTGFKKVITRFGITATPDHPFITTRGIKRFDKLNPSDTIYTCKETLLSIKKKNIVDIQKLSKDKEGFTIGGIQKESLNRFIARFGLIILERYLRVKLFIIKTIIHLITKLVILSVLPLKNTQKDTLLKKWKKKLELTLKLQEKKLLNGTKVRRVGSSTQKLQNYHTRIEKNIIKIVRFVESYIQLITQKNQCIVPKNVNQKAIKKDFVYNLTIEDNHEFFANGVLVHNCDATGSEWKGQKVGTFGDLATVSFYPAHHLTTFGEGGAILTNDYKLYRKCKSIRDWGRDCTCKYNESGCKSRFSNPPFDHKYYYTNLGMNLKMTEAQASFGVVQLDRLDDFIAKRKANYAYLKERINFPVVEAHSDASVSWFSLPIVSKHKKEVVTSYLESQGIQTRAIFAGNITKHPAYKNTGKIRISLDNTDKIMNNGFFVGLHPGLSKKDLDYIIEKLNFSIFL